MPRWGLRHAGSDPGRRDGLDRNARGPRQGEAGKTA
jgi:hypothetical protein